MVKWTKADYQRRFRAMLEYDSKLEQCDQLKKTLDDYRPLDSDILEQLKRYYRVSLTYSSNALEGNALTEVETKVVLEDGITIGGKPLRDHMEAVGHAKAYDHLYELLGKSDVREQDLLDLHQLVTHSMAEASPGRYREKAVIITGTEFIPPSPKDVPAQMREFVSNKLPQWLTTHHPIEATALAHLELVTIHPFIDGNGRTARLLMNLLLMRAGYCVTIIPPVLRRDYIATLDTAHTQGDTQPFLNFTSHIVYESLKDMRRLVQALKS